MNEKNLEWVDVENLVSLVNSKIKFSSRVKQYDWVISINRGGLIPGVLLSHKLGVRHGVMSVSHHDGYELLDKIKKDLYISMIGMFRHADKVLIVDDIADSGECLQATIKTIRRIDPDIQTENIDTATLHYKPQSIIVPTYYGDKIDNDVYVNYPWETQVASEDGLQEKTAIAV